jgi:hypothetical protein
MSEASTVNGHWFWSSAAVGWFATDVAVHVLLDRALNCRILHQAGDAILGR